MSSNIVPDHGFILAAGKGTRLKPYTDFVPKPLVEVGGKPLIDHAIDHLMTAGVNKLAVNLHYMADLLENHLAGINGPQISISHEEELLETGGGLKKGLPYMGANPFFVVSGDSLWTDGPSGSALRRMAKFWDPQKMDILILLQPVETMVLTQGIGDYDVTPDGYAVRSPEKHGKHMWTSIRICKPEIFESTPEGPFSFLGLLDQAEEKGRLFALVHDGDWHHISTAEDLERVNAANEQIQKTA